MTKNQKRKDRKVQQLSHMIVAVMTHVATVFAAVMSAARCRKWVHEINGIHGVMALDPNRVLISSLFNESVKM